MTKKKEFNKQILKEFSSFLFAKKEYLFRFQDVRFWIYPRSDNLFVLNETFIKDEYFEKKILNESKTIVDLGAYLGDFTVWVKKRFKPQLVIALEPSEKLFRLLKKNLKENNTENGVKSYQEAVFSTNEKAGFRQGVFSAINTISKDNSKNAVQGVTLQYVLDRDNVEVLDLLKMDIEGSEKYVLTERNKEVFKKRVKFIMLEAHDLNGNKKEDSIEYFRELGYIFEYTRVPWFFGIYRLVGENPALVNKP